MTTGGKHFELDLGHSGNHNSTTKKTVMKAGSRTASESGKNDELSVLEAQDNIRRG